MENRHFGNFFQSEENNLKKNNAKTNLKYFENRKSRVLQISQIQEIVKKLFKNIEKFLWMKHKRAYLYNKKKKNVPRDFFSLKGVDYDAQFSKVRICARYPLIGQSSIRRPSYKIYDLTAE